MAFQANQNNTKKGFYSVFVSLENIGISSMETLLNDIAVFLRKFPSYIEEELIGAVDTVNLSNANKDLIIITTATTTAVNTSGLSDMKPRMIFNNSPTGTVTVSNGSEGTLNISYRKCALILPDNAVRKGLFPIGTCLSELTFATSKGDETKINSGDMIVTSANTNIDFILPAVCEDSQIIINSISPVGILFLSLNTRNNVYENNLVPFAGLEIKGNALGQTVVSIVKENTTFDTVNIIER